jgi:hypothetical protein
VTEQDTVRRTRVLAKNVRAIDAVKRGGRRVNYRIKETPR